MENFMPLGANTSAHIFHRYDFGNTGKLMPQGFKKSAPISRWRNFGSKGSPIPLCFKISARISYGSSLTLFAICTSLGVASPFFASNRCALFVLSKSGSVPVRGMI